MSCEQRMSTFSRIAAAGSGISPRQNKLSGLAGRMADSLRRSMGRAATNSLALVESFDGPPSLDSLGAAAAVVEAGAMAASLRGGRAGGNLPDWANRWLDERVRRQDKARTALGAPPHRDDRRRDQAMRRATRLRRQALLGLGLLKLVQSGSAFAGTGLARLSRTERADQAGGIEQKFFFPNTTRLPVRMWQTRLTSYINRRELGLYEAKRSEGRVFELRGRSWHRGVMTVQTGRDERTMTHLQSLSLPQTHYYFSRRLSDNETVGVISGQKGFEPKYLDGYAGQVSEVESLAPAWAACKRSLIRASLRWDAPDGGLGSKGGGGAGESRTDRIHPLDGVRETVRLNGREWPVLVRRLDRSGDHPLAEAIYYDDRAEVWQPVEAESVRRRLAEHVEAGRIELWETEEADD